MVTVSGKIEQDTPHGLDAQSPEIIVLKHTKNLKRHSQISIPLPYLQTPVPLLFVFNLQHLALKFHLSALRTRSKEYSIKFIILALLLILKFNGKYASHTHTRARARARTHTTRTHHTHTRHTPNTHTHICVCVCVYIHTYTHTYTYVLNPTAIRLLRYILLYLSEFECEREIRT